MRCRGQLKVLSSTSEIHALGRTGHTMGIFISYLSQKPVLVRCQIAPHCQKPRIIQCAAHSEQRHQPKAGKEYSLNVYTQRAHSLFAASCHPAHDVPCTPILKRTVLAARCDIPEAVSDVADCVMSDCFNFLAKRAQFFRQAMAKGSKVLF